MLLFVQNCKEKKIAKKRQRLDERVLPCEVLRKAKLVLIKHAQASYAGYVKKTSPIAKLSQFIEEGMLRVGGQL